MGGGVRSARAADDPGDDLAEVVGGALEAVVEDFAEIGGLRGRCRRGRRARFLRSGLVFLGRWFVAIGVVGPRHTRHRSDRRSDAQRDS